MLAAGLLKKLSLVKPHCVPEAGISTTSTLPPVPTSRQLHVSCLGDAIPSLTPAAQAQNVPLSATRAEQRNHVTQRLHEAFIND